MLKASSREKRCRFYHRLAAAAGSWYNRCFSGAKKSFLEARSIGPLPARQYRGLRVLVHLRAPETGRASIICTDGDGALTTKKSRMSWQKLSFDAQYMAGFKAPSAEDRLFTWWAPSAFAADTSARLSRSPRISPRSWEPVGPPATDIRCHVEGCAL